MYFVLQSSGRFKTKKKGKVSDFLAMVSGKPAVNMDHIEVP